LWKRPAEADEEKLIATATTATEAIKRRMDLSPKLKTWLHFPRPTHSGCLTILAFIQPPT
jgi:hypothetical protein